MIDQYCIVFVCNGLSEALDAGVYGFNLGAEADLGHSAPGDRVYVGAPNN